GPTLGGYLTKTISWRAIFWVNLPVGIIAVAAALAILRQDKPAKGSAQPFDFWGFGFLAAFLVSFLLALSKGDTQGWTSPYIVTCFIISALGLIGFLTV